MVFKKPLTGAIKVFLLIIQWIIFWENNGMHYQDGHQKSHGVGDWMGHRMGHQTFHQMSHYVVNGNNIYVWLF